MSNQKEKVFPETFEEFLLQHLADELQRIDEKTTSMIQKAVHDTLVEVKTNMKEEEPNKKES